MFSKTKNLILVPNGNYCYYEGQCSFRSKSYHYGRDCPYNRCKFRVEEIDDEKSCNEKIDSVYESCN